MYTQDEEQLKDVIEDLEIANALMGKSRVQVIKLIIKAIDNKLEEGNSAAKIAFLKGIQSTLVDDPPPLEMDETEKPGKTDKLTFVSLTHQIDSGLKRGYKERDLVDAIIRSISPHSSLRSYIETFPALSLAKLRKILPMHYREKTASELYQQLATAYQQPKETPQQFLLRALDVRNKVSFASQEVDCEINYDFPFIQKTLLKSFETGLRDDILATNLRPILRIPGLSDEDLMKQVNELAQVERQSNLGTNAHQRTSKVSAASVNLNQEIGQVSLKLGDTCRTSDSVQLLQLLGDQV